ncbi:Protein of unknown function [Bacillus wiedmannii]|uniref:Uncharacterized protein n=1 Tax=Bacillus wiedmannii TaxID=1890302 RepID=A0A1C6X8V7_9BACI|nr:Protein of unknown function [Bacillus wiedmannii]SCL99562.1 Protein of unknown function [Bacillus wiedmannii]
MEDTLKNTHPI